MDISFLISLVTYAMIVFMIAFALLSGIKKWLIDPNIFTVLGVLGTFLGIFLGLLNFDVTNIENSVPELLQGLKMAFATSIVGMFIAIVIKLRRKFRERSEGMGAEGATIDTLADSLNQNNQSIQSLLASNKSGFESIVAALSGDDEGTLLTQLQKLRTSLLDKTDELIKEFKAFAETQAENNSKALIEALESVIRDFNVKITEQFGDNFKQLNDAVGKMLDWQKFYSDQIQDLITQFKFASEAMNLNKQILETMIAKYNDGLAITKELEIILTAYSAYNKKFEDNLKNFIAIGEKAQEVLPTLESKVLELTEQISKTVDASGKMVEGALESQREQTKVLLTNISQNFAESSESMHKSILEQTNKINTLIGEGLAQFDSELEKALSVSLQMFGNQMADISGKFAEDYLPIATRLKEILSIAEER